MKKCRILAFPFVDNTIADAQKRRIIAAELTNIYAKKN